LAKREASESAGQDGSLAVLSGKKALEQNFKRQMTNLQQRMSKQEEIRQQKSQLASAAVQRVEELKVQLAQEDINQEQVLHEQAQLEQTEKEASNQGFLAQLRSLVALNESLKKQEAQFKASCKEQLAELQTMIQKLESDENDEETQRMLEIERIYDADLAKLNKLRQVLAKKNQEIARIVRAIDDIPTRAELIQYERRFVELYELVAEKLVETRKYYAMYNTLEEKHRYMSNEVSLLESIAQNFPKSSQSSKGLEAFLTSFKGILDGVDQNVEHVSKEVVSDTSVRDSTSEKYKQLLDKQRKYFKAVKEFQEECNKNEKLAEALATVQRQLAQ